jgi:hypothetical protein
MCDLGRDLGLKAKPILFEFNVLEYLTPEELVSCLHVGQVQIIDGIAQEREHEVSHGMPEEQHTAFSPADESGAIDNVCVILQAWTDEDLIIARVVLQVRILDDDILAEGLADPPTQRSAFPPVAWLEDQSETLIGSARNEIPQDPASPIGRSVIDDDQLHDYGLG